MSLRSRLSRWGRRLSVSRAGGARESLPRHVKGTCRVCGSDQVRKQIVSDHKSDRTQPARVCRSCGHVTLPTNTHDYTQTESTNELALRPRVGTEEVPGREFGMAKLAAAVLDRPGLSVLVYGAGRSLDNRHIATLPQVSRVAIGDVFRARDDVDFVDLTQPVRDVFDVVVACEVIEHFVDPRREFARLLGLVRGDGLVVCSTNIYDGGDLNRQAYVFGRGHVSYYSPAALRLLARNNGFLLDFRLPRAALGTVGPRKRYVLFSRSPQVMEAISDYFGSHPYAPSEKPVPRSTPARPAG